MFVGPAYASETLRRDKHYSVAFSAKSQRNKIPLWILFVGWWQLPLWASMRSLPQLPFCQKGRSEHRVV